MHQPLVSITITTKNEAKNIENCLKSIKEQTYENIEIIVVDNKSEDNTEEIARAYTYEVYDKGPERSAQRNYGMINKSKGEYVMFVDADMIFSPTLIESCVELIEESDYLALHIPEIVLGKKFFSRVRRFERSFYNGTVIDGARFFKKDAFAKVKGFDEAMSGPEDWDIDKKIEQIGKIGIIPNTKISQSRTRRWGLENLIKEKGGDSNISGAVIYHNEAEFDLKKYLDKKGYYAKSFDNYIKKWGQNDPDIKKQLGFYYRFLGVFVENGKWTKLLVHPFLTLGMYYLRFSVGLKFIQRKKTLFL